jgi:hypothetical protein
LKSSRNNLDSFHDFAEILVATIDRKRENDPFITSCCWIVMWKVGTFHITTPG